MLYMLVIRPEDAGGSHSRLEPEFARQEVRIRIEGCPSRMAYKSDELHRTATC
jgi:hypothetical protein